MQMIQEARPWLVDFHAAAALDSFPVFWVFALGFLVVSASWDLDFSPWVVPSIFCVSRSGLFSLSWFWYFLPLVIWVVLLGLFLVFSEF